MTKLSDVFLRRSGGYWGAEQGSASFDARAIRNGDVMTSGEIRWSKLPTRGYSVREYEKARVRKGDIVLTSSGNCGNAAFVEIEPVTPTVATNFVRILRVDKTNVDAKYAFHFLRSAAFTAGIRPHVRGATIKNLSVEAALREIDIPLPPLREQQRIATILDQANTVRAKRRQILAHLDSLTQAIFHEMFGGVPATSTVEAQASLIRTGPFGSQLLHGEFVNDGIAVLGLDNVVGNEFTWGQRRFITPAKYEQLKRYTVTPGDVLISIMGTVGRCVVVPSNIPTAINTKHICAITPDSTNLDPAFLRAAFLWHPDSRAHLRRQTKGSIMDGLNMGIIKAMPIPLPSLSQQETFAERAAAVAAHRASALRVLAADDELFTSLQSRAFRGEL